MTQTTAAQAVPSPRLERPLDTPFRGVCAALARTTGTDPVLWRVTLAVLSVFGGLGVALYVVGWVLIPQQGEAQSLGERLLRGPDRRLTTRQVLLVALPVALAVAVLGARDNVLGPVVVLGGLAYLVHRRRGAGPVPATASSYDAAVPGTPSVPRPRSVLGRLTVSAGVLLTGVLVLLAALGVDGITAPRVLAADLLVVGAGLVVGAFWGRARGLVLLAVVLALALAASVASRDVTRDGVGNRTWVPTGSGSYRLGVGEGTLDLRSLPRREGGDPVRLSARLQVGHLLVLVPEGMRLSVTARARLGDLLLDGHDTNGDHARAARDVGPPGVPQVLLDASVRTGQVEVRRG